MAFSEFSFGRLRLYRPSPPSRSGLGRLTGLTARPAGMTHPRAFKAVANLGIRILMNSRSTRRNTYECDQHLAYLHSTLDWCRYSVAGGKDPSKSWLQWMVVPNLACSNPQYCSALDFCHSPLAKLNALIVMRIEAVETIPPSGWRGQWLNAIRLVIGRLVHFRRYRPDLDCCVNVGIDLGL